MKRAGQPTTFVYLGLKEMQEHDTLSVKTVEVPGKLGQVIAIKLRHREAMSLSWGHTASKQKSWNLILPKHSSYRFRNFKFPFALCDLAQLLQFPTMGKFLR